MGDLTALDPQLQDFAVVCAGIAERLCEVARIVPVMSGKGGVGKSAIAVNLAIALAQRGERVGLLDADLNSPSVAAMLGLRGRPVRMRGTDLLPQEAALGVRVQSFDFFLQSGQALDWDGPAGEGAPLRSALEEAALADLLGQTAWGALDTLVIDLAPGPDRLPALARLLPPQLGAIAVAIPTEVALLAVLRSVRRAYDAQVPMLGLVENMGSSVCAACGHEAPLFHEADVERASAEFALRLLARIPFEPRLAAAGDAGVPLALGAGADSLAARRFAELAAEVGRYVAPRMSGVA